MLRKLYGEIQIKIKKLKKLKIIKTLDFNGNIWNAKLTFIKKERQKDVQKVEEQYKITENFL